MVDASSAPARADLSRPTGAVVLADGSVIYGEGFGAAGEQVGELCFNTAMTGYQEVLTDPSYDRQIITFTFPHIGNVGTNDADEEAGEAHALGLVVRERPTAPSNFRSTAPLDEWLKRRGRIGVAGVDTRALTHLIRRQGAPNAVIVHAPDGRFDLDRLAEKARNWPGLEGMDLAGPVSTGALHAAPKAGFGLDTPTPPHTPDSPHIVAIDYGMKRAILTQLEAAGARVSVLPANTRFETLMALAPDGLFLSNGPGDPAATGAYAVPLIQAWLATGKPLFGICLGHQLLGLALGGRTVRMHQGHRGANHPVRRLADGGVEITSMNHGFSVDAESLKDRATLTHISLFDASLCGLQSADGQAFSVQYHPEASPGPQDSHYLFHKFIAAARAARTERTRS